MKKGVFIILTTLFFAFSCSEEPLNDSFELNKLQTFIPGVTYHLENTETTFRINNVSDSRCPKRATCIWAGMVQIDLIFQSLTTDTLRLNTLNNQSDTIENYVFHLMEVDPYPELDKEINLEDYRLTMNIFKN
ncbi:MAG TPA: hypothetical protein VKA38_03790 [Draconibacterium sp.]|nr:hypothetical protein [Draconibacterium sp.]